MKSCVQTGLPNRSREKAIHYAELAYKNGAIPVTPHLLFPFMNDEDINQREDALFMDIILLGKCQELWVFGGEITEGMKKELEIAEKRKQVIKYFDSTSTEVEINA